MYIECGVYLYISYCSNESATRGSEDTKQVRVYGVLLQSDASIW